MSRNFNGTSDYASATAGSWGNGTTFTLAAWAKTTSATKITNKTKQGILCTADSSTPSLGDLGLDLQFDQGASSNYDVCLNYYNGGSSQNHCEGFSNNITSATTWYHCAGTCSISGGNSNLVTYFNGVQQNTKTVGSAGSLTTITNSLIGTSAQNTSPAFLTGLVADAAIWNVVLTAGEIAALAAGARPCNIRPASLVEWWPLDGLQSPEPDLSGAGHNATLSSPSASTGPPVALFTPRWHIRYKLGSR